MKRLTEEHKKRLALDKGYYETEMTRAMYNRVASENKATVTEDGVTKVIVRVKGRWKRARVTERRTYVA